MNIDSSGMMKLVFRRLWRTIGFPKWYSGKESACSARDARDWCSISGSGRSPWKRAWQPTPVFLPGKFHRQRSLAGCSPWGLKELDTTE